jgi:CubicO group peptidase (beta-lactamase class C family)
MNAGGARLHSMKKAAIRLTLSALCCMALIASHAAVMSQDLAPATIMLTPEDLQSFLNRVVPEQLARRKIAGAVVVAVVDDAVLFSRGYGFADIENKAPMSADSTLVRPGSISKLFTAIAVMQLVEQDKLDLDRDVNDYLDFHVPTPNGGVPVTLRMLLTHRAGFENHLKGLFLAGTKPPPLNSWVRESLPQRLFANGDVPAYSNYGYALAGYVVERVTGERFEDYASSRILKPLGMSSSTFVQPLPEALAPLMSRGYLQSTAPALPYFEVIPPSPAGGMSTTGADMGRFIIALLDDKRMSDSGVMRPETMARMMTPRDSTEGVVDQPLMGFEEEYAAGNVDIGKHGLTLGFVTEVALLPARSFGLFVSYNSASAGGLPTELIRALADRYFRQPPHPPMPLATAPADAAGVAGSYQISQREDSNFFRLPTLLQQLVVTSLPDGKLRVFGETLVETSPLHFQSPDDLHVEFKRSDSAHRLTLRTSAVPLALEWQRLPWYLDARIVLPVVKAAIVTVIATLVLWPIAAFMRRRRRTPFGRTQKDRRHHLWVRAVLGLDVLTLAGILLFAAIASDITRLNAGLDPALASLYLCAWLGSLGAAVVIWAAFRFWRDRIGTLWARVHHVLLAAAAAVLAYFFVTWRIAGVTLNY